MHSVVPVERIPDSKRLVSAAHSPCQHNEIGIFEKGEY